MNLKELIEYYDLNIDKISVNSKHYDCVIEPCKDGISKECVLLPGVKPLQYEPVSLNANLNIIYRRTNMKGKYIKSGTSNFVSNDGDFPLVVYIAETYRVDDETGEETDERDYDAEQWEYDDAYDSAKDLADEMNIPLSKEGYRRSLDGGYYNMPYSVGITSGYYEGIQIQIEDNLYFDPEEIANDEGLLDDFEYAEDQADYDRVVKEVEERVTNEWETRINEYLNKLCSDYGWMKLGVSARFSNGETWYSKIDSAKKNKKRKPADEKAKDEGAESTCARRPIKSSNNDILYKCKKILDKYGADYRGGEIENINGKNYITFRYYGGLNDTVDQNDDSWDEMYDIDGVVDVGYGEGYGDNMEGTNYHNNVDCLIIELDDKIESSKKLTSGQKRNRDSLKSIIG